MTRSRIVDQPRRPCQAPYRCNALSANGLALCLAALAAAGSAACGGRSAVPRPFPTPGGTARSGVASPASPLVEGMLRTATDLIGTPYRNGGSTVDGFDCSGFVQYVFAQALGIDLPDNSISQAEAGVRVARNELKTGDLVFFHTRGKGISHVGIYLDNGRFIHSPSTGKRVRVDELSDQYWARHYVGARRPEVLSS